MYIYLFLPLYTFVRKEGVLVPHVVRCCVEEVERRGMDEVGLYRVSGDSSDVGALKNEFNSSKKKLPLKTKKIEGLDQTESHLPC